MAAQPYVIHALPGVPQLGGDGLLVASPRGRLLDAMTAAVAENGYAATSVAEVINRARASRRTFYEHFADKEACYLAAYTLASNYIAGRVVEAMAGASTPADRLARLIRSYLEELAAYPLAARAFLVEIRAAGAPSQRHRRSIQDQFAELLRSPGSDDDPLMRTALVAANDELLARAITDDGTDRLAELEPGLIEVATRILMPDRPFPSEQ
jgi:AcrR family transcriptional regulator